MAAAPDVPVFVEHKLATPINKYLNLLTEYLQKELRRRVETGTGINSLLFTAPNGSVYEVSIDSSGGLHIVLVGGVVGSKGSAYGDCSVKGCAKSTYTPVVTSSGGGAFGAASAVGSLYMLNPSLVLVNVQVTITTIGAATGFPIVTLPITPSLASPNTLIIVGRETAVNGKMLQGLVGGGITMPILNYDNSAPLVAGTNLVLSGVYPI